MLWILIISLMLLGGYLYLFHRKKPKIHCLMYHHINPENNLHGVFIQDFQQQMEKIKGYQTFTFQQVIAKNYQLPANSILITFDDGYRSNYELAYPILKQFNLKATIFLNTKYIDIDENYLTWQQIQEMYQSGLIDFQLHTHSHSLIPKSTEVTGFYDHSTSEYLKRESFSLFFKGLYRQQQHSNLFNGLPLFKFRSRLAVKGYLPHKDFISKYQQIVQQKAFQQKNLKQRQIWLSQHFKQQQSHYFQPINKKQFFAYMYDEIKQNQQLIKQHLGYNATALAYPWGQRSHISQKYLKQLGVNTFITTKKGANSSPLNPNCIYRLDCETFKNIEDFSRNIQCDYGYWHYKVKKLFMRK
ncbi:polysaccharide deacetylase [Volucribacter psittacicida]|uniref:Polysaccharide deacetylase n=1 Tax=Volucribacter psittacicida TaxID=203482 RepID=A0A4R1G4R1_9PAST|nr:polysaccharide deacetylase family protein [Volucribacter psittacicida]TCK01473.1 polysaccharide deacetylase [Volucribacter psittacicida]